MPAAATPDYLRLVRSSPDPAFCRWVTVWSAGREPVFAIRVADHLVVTPLGQLARQSWFNLTWEYPAFSFDPLTIRPDRVESLVRGPQRPGRPDPLRGIIAHFKALVVRSTQGHGPVWARGYTARSVPGEREVLQVRRLLLPGAPCQGRKGYRGPALVK